MVKMNPEARVKYNRPAIEQPFSIRNQISETLTHHQNFQLVRYKYILAWFLKPITLMATSIIFGGYIATELFLAFRVIWFK